MEPVATAATWCLRSRLWRLMRGRPSPPPAVFEAWNGLWQGALMSHERIARWQVVDRLDQDDDAFRWRIRRG